MAYSRIQHSGGAVPTTLSSDIVSGDTSLTLNASTGWPDGSIGPFYLVIDVGLANEEKILAAGRTTNTLTSLTRGVDGTSASDHAAGAAIVHCFTATEADEANVTANKTIGQVTTKGDLLAATGNQALARVAAGANNTVLVADSTQTAGLKYSQIVAANITAGTITTTEIADGTITGTDIATGTITSANITDGTIATADIASGAITTGLVAANAITSALLAAGAVGVTQLASGLASARDFIQNVVGADADVNNAAYTDYGISGSSTVPSWATSAIVRTNISGTSVTSTSNSRFRTQIGTNQGNEHFITTNGDSSNECVAYADKITLTATGAQTVKVQARRGSGTGAYRMQGTLDRMSFDITYLP